MELPARDDFAEEGGLAGHFGVADSMAGRKSSNHDEIPS
jgi:hypothetical protein